MKTPDTRARLEAVATGTAKRPRGNAVLPIEHAAAAPLARACRDLVNGTLHNHDLYDFETGERVDQTAQSIAAPCEALPPLP
jgi:hypothetical protein